MFLFGLHYDLHLTNGLLITTSFVTQTHLCQGPYLLCVSWFAFLLHADMQMVNTKAGEPLLLSWYLKPQRGLLNHSSQLEWPDSVHQIGQAWPRSQQLWKWVWNCSGNVLALIRCRGSYPLEGEHIGCGQKFTYLHSDLPVNILYLHLSILTQILTVRQKLERELVSHPIQ